MSYDWSEFLVLAQSLQSNPDCPGPREAALRSAASRAYYAAFHRAVEFAVKEGYYPSNSGDDHKSVQAHFRDYKPKAEKRTKVARELGKLLVERHKADYRVNIGKRPESLAIHAIGMATRIIEYLNALNS